jgi:predicted Zn-dependent peptidase
VRSRATRCASSEVVSAKADSALLEFVKELRAIREPVPTAELEKATQYLQRQLPGDFETTGDVARQLRTVAQYGLPRDYWATWAGRIGAVSADDVRRAATKYVDPSHLAIVIVGDRKSLEPALKATGVAPVQVVDLEGNPVP